jgi:hypothetical protein
MRFAAAQETKVHPPRPLPSWARLSDAGFEQLDSSLFAGAALASLDALIRSEPLFGGVWRNRLALRAAAATVRMTGRPEGEEELRDAWFLSGRDGALGPAGDHLQAWRSLVSSSTPSASTLTRTGEKFGLGRSAPIAEIFALVERTETDANPIRAAAQAAAAIYNLTPTAEFLGLWVADFVLAQRLRWSLPLPLIADQIGDPTNRRAAGAKTSRPSDEAWEKLVTVAVAKAAASAIDLAGELSRRADKLVSRSTKLRAKGAGEVIATLLADDALAPSSCLGGMSDRAMRRLCDRLVALEAVRELTRRPTFRLYGL